MKTLITVAVVAFAAGLAARSLVAQSSPRPVRIKAAHDSCGKDAQGAAIECPTVDVLLMLNGDGTVTWRDVR
jgi:hypothetical protein